MLICYPALIEAHPLKGSLASSTAQTVVLPILKRDSLLNGLQIVLMETQGVGKVTARLRINSGAMFDLAGKGGLADITAGMLLAGGGGYNAKNIQDTVEQSGMRINITTNWDSTDITMSGPPDTLSTIFDLLGRIIVTPTFDQKEFDALKARRISEIKSQSSDASELVFARAMETVYGSHPYGRPMRGTAESVEKITQPDLTYFHKRFYLANNSTLVIAGEATLDQITPLARAKLGAWKKGEKVPATFRPNDPPTARKVVIVDRPDVSNSTAAIAQTGISRRANDYFAALIMREVLSKQISGQGSAQIGMDARVLQGPLWVTLQSPKSEIDKQINSVLDSMSQFKSAQPAAEAVERAKSDIISEFAKKMSTPEGAAGVILDIELYGLGRDYLVTFADRVNAVTLADIQKAAQTYLKPQTAAVIVAGPAKELDATLKNLGTVTVMP
jgi:predicted Zn-dependent peptidase